MIINIYRWQGSGVNEVGVDKSTKEVRVTVDPKYYRPSEVDLLLGNPAKAKKILGWEPKISFEVFVLIDHTLINDIVM